MNNKTKPLVRMQSVCGQCTKSSCRGCSNYLGREQQASTVVSSLVTDFFAVVALVGTLFIFIII